jgi:hypothetical protein
MIASALPSDGALSRSPSLNVGRWLLSEKNSMRNTRPRSASTFSRQRLLPGKNIQQLSALTALVSFKGIPLGQSPRARATDVAEKTQSKFLMFP